MKKTLLTVTAFAAVIGSTFGQAPITNNNMETWGSTIGEPVQPTGYISANIFKNSFVDPNNPTSVSQEVAPNNYQGTYSARLETVVLLTNPDPASIPDTLGALSLGTVTVLPSIVVHNGGAYTHRPQILSYYAKYAPMPGDTGWCWVELTKWNGAGRDIIAAGFDYMTTAVPTYSLRTVTMVYDVAFQNATPDTISVIFSASSTYTPQVGSVMHIDAISVTGWNGVDDHAFVNNVVNAFPNPASTEMTFEVTAATAKTIEVYDVAGRQVDEITIENKEAKLAAWKMAGGMYTYAIFDENRNVMNRGKFNVVK
ncbi:MAG: hypothetical protein FD123_2487 [Bacteroidetes bacterium]|nr:MAG: hypothetical protein FD123_2487 [Bacteroidota bacterium]